MISWANIKALTDSIGVQLDRAKTAFGTGTESGSVSKAATTNLGRVQTIAGTDARAAADLLEGSIDHLNGLVAGAKKIYQLFSVDVKNIENHLRNNSSTYDAQAASAGERFSPSFAEVARANGTTLASQNVFSPLSALATFAASGSGAGTFTDGAAIDTTKYGCASIQAKATAACSNVAITASVTDESGTATTATGTLDGNTGTTVDLTVASGKRVKDVTGVTIAGGGTGQTFTIQTKLDRTPVE